MWRSERQVMILANVSYRGNPVSLEKLRSVVEGWEQDTTRDSFTTHVLLPNKLKTFLNVEINSTKSDPNKKAYVSASFPGMAGVSNPLDMFVGWVFDDKKTAITKMKTLLDRRDFIWDRAYFKEHWPNSTSPMQTADIHTPDGKSLTLRDDKSPQTNESGTSDGSHSPGQPSRSLLPTTLFETFNNWSLIDRREHPR